MSVQHTPQVSTRPTSVQQEVILGLLTQTSESTSSTPGGVRSTGTVDDVAIGHEFTLLARVGIEANSPAAATNYDHLWFNKNAPFKFRVMEVRHVTQDVTAGDYTAADGGDLRIIVARGDGATVETFTTIVDANLDENVPANNLATTYPNTSTGLDLAQSTIAAGESLRVRVTLDPDATAGATNDGGMFDVICRCMRVN